MTQIYPKRLRTTRTKYSPSTKNLHPSLLRKKKTSKSENRETESQSTNRQIGETVDRHRTETKNEDRQIVCRSLLYLTAKLTERSTIRGLLYDPPLRNRSKSKIVILTHVGLRDPKILILLYFYQDMKVSSNHHFN